MKRVLIVDDDVANLYLLRVLLQGNGYTVIECRNGQEALAEAMHHPPALIISDLLMPVMDGYTLLRNWNKEARLKAVPFVVYTATYTEPQDERLAMDLGAAAFIVKPEEPGVLIERIEAAIAGKRRENRVARRERRSDDVLLGRYNEVLVAKLQKKMLQLGEANKELVKKVEEHEKTGAALQESERRYRQLFQSITDPIFVYDSESLAYLAVNDAAVCKYGYTEAEFLRLTVRDLVPPEDRPLLEKHPAITGADSGRRVWRNQKKDGEIIEVELSAFDIEFSGHPACVAQARDVTERRRLETRFRQAQKMEAVGRLTGGVAHDFNNLITVIDGYCELMQQNVARGDPLDEPLSEIRKASGRAGALTRQLLAFSRQQVLELRILDLNAVVRGAENMLCRLAGKEVEVLLKLDPTIGMVEADSGQMEQVLMNLVINARDAMPDGGTITIETQVVRLDEAYCSSFEDLDEGDYVLLAVSDTGIGMSDTTRAKIFEPFFTTKPVGRGTGLGLSTAHGIVRQSRGHIGVYSEPGHGTIFRVYLPQVTGQVSGVRPVTLQTEIPRGSETILLVEDDESVRPLVVRVLSRCGYEVLEAGNGSDAIQLAANRSDPVNLLVSDVVMPGMGGRELAGRIVAIHPECKVLFISGYTNDAVIRHGVVASEFAFLQKPFTASSVARKVRSILDS